MFNLPKKQKHQLEMESCSFIQGRITKNVEKYIKILHMLNKMYLEVFLLDVLVPISISTYHMY